MDISYGKPVESVRRFTLFKWATAAVLLALLLVGWLAGGPARDGAASTGTVIEAAPPGGLASSRPAAGGQGEAVAGSGSGTTVSADRKPASFTIERAADGSITVSGTVDNEVTRDQWLNAIRIGAQGTPVRGRFDVADVAAAPVWAGQLSSLVAVMRESRISAVSVEGDRVVLRGTLGSAADKASAEQVMQAQLPSGYRLDSRLASGAVAAGGPAAKGASSSAGASPTSPSSAAGPGAGAPTAASGASAAASAASATGGPGGAGGVTLGGSDASGASGGQKQAALADSEGAPSKAPSKSVSCPKRIRSLAQSVYFRTDSAALPSKESARLERLGACLGRHSVRIIGHADPRHTDEYNIALSRRRAQAVAQALSQGGAPEERLTIVAAGRTSEKATSRAAMQRARRVDIIVR